VKSGLQVKMNHFSLCQDTVEEFVQTKMGGETLAQVAQRSCGCPLLGSAQDQVGWSSEHPGLVEDVPAYGRGVGTR